MNVKRIIQNTLLVLSVIILVYTYYYLPGQYSKIIKVEDQKVTTSVQKDQKQNKKNTFTNTEYKSQNSKGEIYTTKAQETYIYAEKPDLIHLINPYSFTRLKKDQTLIEITSNTGLYDKEKKITSYDNKVTIKNKNYIITANFAKYISEKNMIFISGNVVMKDLTLGLSHIAYSDIVEINTSTNDTIAYMNSESKRVVAKKFK
jgi:cell division protein FtsB